MTRAGECRDSCFPLPHGGNSDVVSFLATPENFLRHRKIAACKQLAMSRQSSTTGASRCRIPNASYIRVDDAPRSTCVHAPGDFAARACASRSLSLHIACVGGIAAAREAAPRPPSQLYGALFQRVQTERIFADSKTFADAVAKSAPDEIMRRYAAEQGSRGIFAAATSSPRTSSIPGAAASEFQTAPREEIRAHIDRLWPR